MKLILMSDNGSYHKKINVKLWATVLSVLLMFFLLVATALTTYHFYKKGSISRNEIKLLNKFDSTLMKISKLEAEVQRLNELSTTLANHTKVDIQAFLLENTPARGGLSQTKSDGQGVNSPIIKERDLLKSIDEIEARLKQQKTRLQVLNQVLKKKESEKNISVKTSFDAMGDFYSSPVKTGYVSSLYGKRRDPINGHQRHHNGIDIAGRHGSDIHTIASGFVTFVGRKGAYGNVIEINHSDSLKSRYAHLSKMTVKRGSVVRKGDVIGKMGKTGRATGSHLHLEVWQKDRPVNPKKFIEPALKKLSR